MTDFALLAPVPLMHLGEGRDTCIAQGKVAFGSRAWEVFRDLDEKRHNQPVDVYIYASMEHADGSPAATWRAEYIGHVEAKMGAHPAGMRYRPLSTANYPSDNYGHWAVFWEVTNLRMVDDNEQVLVKDLQGVGGNYFKPEFIPQGPIIIQSPPRLAATLSE